MRLVDKPDFYPFKCVISGDAGDEGPYVDTEFSFPVYNPSYPEPRIFLKASRVRELGRFVGMVDGLDVEALRDERDGLERACAELRDEVARLSRELEAVDLLESAGFRRRKRPGRPRKLEVDE